MRVAIVGCGQLSRMLALAGLPLGIQFSFIAEAGEPTVCVDGLGAIVVWQPGDDIALLYQQLGQPNCVTIEKEQVDIALLESLSQYCSVYPSLKAIRNCQHRHLEKQLLEQLNIPCANYVYLQSGSAAPAQNNLANLSPPLIAKSCQEGYDGKNQRALNNSNDIDHFICSNTNEWIIEEKILFHKEISQISVRSINGDIGHYPLTENIHSDGILHQSIAPATAIPQQLQTQAQDDITRLMNELNYVGVMAMECFVVNDQLLINELAPRVHNSGHWTQLGSVTCQFENHLRAITGLTLGSTTQHKVAGMINLLGTAAPPLSKLSEHSTVQWYNKAIKPCRKQGHVNFIGESHHNLQQQMAAFKNSNVV